MTELYENPETISFTTPFPRTDFIGEIPINSRILDLGCGYGRIMKYMYEKGFYQLDGIDISEKLIERAKEYFPHANYFKSTIDVYQPKDKHDAVLICGVLEYFTDEADRSRLIDKLNEILKKYGYVYVQTFLLDDSNWSNYVSSYDAGERFGTLLLNNGLKLFHDTSSHIDKMFQHHFSKKKSKIEEYITWSGDQVKGYTVLYQKND